MNNLNTNQNLVVVITQKKGDKDGHGQDTVLTAFDMGKTYTSLIVSALAQLDAFAAELDGDEEAIATAVEQQRASWESTVNEQSDGSVGWATPTMYKGVKAIEHKTKGSLYIQGVVTYSKVIELDENRPVEKKTRGSRNEVTATKKQLRRLASGWRMSALNESSMIYTGDEAASILEAVR